MPKESWWIWIDGNLTLKTGAVEKLVKLMGDAEVGVFKNPYRETVGEEMQEIIDLELDDEETVKKQRYYKDGHLAACFLIVRKNTPEVRRRNERWWAEICAGSVRDQISFPHCFWNISKYFPKVHPFDNRYFARTGHLIKRNENSISRGLDIK